MPLLLKEFAGAKFGWSPGYAANDDISLALERKEVDGWTALATTVRNAAEQGDRAPAGARAARRCPGSTTCQWTRIWRPSDIGRALMVIRGTPLAIGRPFACGRARRPIAWRCCEKALTEVIADPKFLAETKTAKIDVAHISAAAVSKGFEAMFNQPPEALEAMHKYLKVGE